MFGKAGCRAEDRSEKPEQPGIGLEKGEELDSGRQPAEETVEGEEGLIGIAGGSQCGEQFRHQLGEKFLGPGAAGRGIAPEMPAADRGRDFAGAAKAHSGQGGDGFGIILAAGKNQAAAFARQLRRILEECRIMALHAFERGAQPGIECRAIGKTTEARQTFESRIG